MLHDGDLPAEGGVVRALRGKPDGPNGDEVRVCAAWCSGAKWEVQGGILVERVGKGDRLGAAVEAERLLRIGRGETGENAAQLVNRKRAYDALDLGDVADGDRDLRRRRRVHELSSRQRGVSASMASGDGGDEAVAELAAVLVLDGRVELEPVRSIRLEARPVEAERIAVPVAARRVADGRPRLSARVHGPDGDLAVEALRVDGAAQSEADTTTWVAIRPAALGHQHRWGCATLDRGDADAREWAARADNPVSEAQLHVGVER